MDKILRKYCVFLAPTLMLCGACGAVDDVVRLGGKAIISSADDVARGGKAVISSADDVARGGKTIIGSADDATYLGGSSSHLAAEKIQQYIKDAGKRAVKTHVSSVIAEGHNRIERESLWNVAYKTINSEMQRYAIREVRQEVISSMASNIVAEVENESSSQAEFY